MKLELHILQIDIMYTFVQEHSPIFFSPQKFNITKIVIEKIMVVLPKNVNFPMD